MINRPLLIGAIATMAFVGTTVASAATDWTANLSDPANPIWQGMPQSSSSAPFQRNNSPYTFTAPNIAPPYANMPVTFRQVIWLIAQYDRFVVQPLRDQVASLQQQVNGMASSSSSSSSFVSCGIHQIGDTYAAPDHCNVCTCTGNGEICTQRACFGSSSSPSSSGFPFLNSSASSCSGFFNSCFAPIGCTYKNPVIQNGCTVSCGTLDCGFTSSFGFQTSSTSSMCPILNCPMIPPGCSPVLDKISGCPIGCGAYTCSNSSSSMSSASICHQVADCAAPPPGCYYRQLPDDFTNCPRTCGTLVCTYNQSSSSSSRGMCATYIRNGSQDTECSVCGDGICSPFEQCTPTSCTNGNCTSDCGSLYCPQDCAGNPYPVR